MQPRLTYRQHARAVLGLGLPLIGSHVAQFAITFTDALMLGWYSVEALAAEVLGGTMFFVLFIMGSGFAWAVMPMVASAQASGAITQVRRITRMGLWASILFGLATLPLMLGSGALFDRMGQEPATAALAADYLEIAGLGILPALMVMVLKSYLAALERTAVVLWVTLGAVALNACVNYLLIFGNFGFPELGVQGAAIASLGVNIASFVVLGVYVHRSAPDHALFQRFWRPDPEALGRVFRLGWPIGLTNLAEVGLFASASIMMGWLGTLPLAAHGIAMQITSVIFMIHLGLSNVATVRAGQAHGRGDGAGLRDGARVVLGLSAAVALATMALLLLVPDPLVGVFLAPDDPDRAEVIAIGRQLLAAAAFFQLMDAAQVQALGLLRGVQDTRVPMVIAALSYWAVGVPVSYLLGFTLGLGGPGIWLGLAMGLALAGVFMLVRFWGWSVRQIPAQTPQMRQQG
ncbi:MAG: MATE family efflux transporter [Roseovarius sp.]|uniref:MATE family efflux transporter n=1 Tax=Roseovarius sp. TaxID=1486281 RepID=UPI001B661BAA|nr:MATE family efflux transporter [Roseovarius sp.]MBQ0750154.1 MATE family efflux transporter [Roseovarius sp.]MBQ0809810.1 MATE family efflux transporter [Roseovarius sp.]